jgi:hypothetical protein
VFLFIPLLFFLSFLPSFPVALMRLFG